MENFGTPREGSNSAADTSIDMERLAVTSMKEKLNDLARLSPECCIYEVPKKLRKINEDAYTPLIVSIGPLNHGKKGLETMEEHKWRYLQDFLDRTQKPLEEYFKFVKEREDRIRQCYAETIKIDSHKFVEIILVDAAFIIEVLSKNQITSNDRIFRKPWMIGDIIRDMAQLENQLPFFILQDLFKMANSDIKVGSSDEDETRTLIELTHAFFIDSLDMLPIPEEIDFSEVEHFLDFLRSCLKPRERKLTRRKFDCKVVIAPAKKHDFIPTATELHEAGVKFEVGSRENLFDIEFESNVLKIPYIKITDSTECLLRNLIALEQCHYDVRFLTDYTLLMDCLINTTKDVELLIQSGVIDNWLGDNENVKNLFNKLCKEVNSSSETFYFSLYNQLNDYCKIRRHKWQATLKQDYCSTPWRVLSIVAAVILLVLTFIQTICSFVPAFKEFRSSP